MAPPPKVGRRRALAGVLTLLPLGLLPAFALPACGVPSFRIDAPRVARLRRVALAGLTFELELRRDLRDRYVETAQGDHDQLVELAAQIAQRIRTRLHERLGVELPEQVHQNGVYRDAMNNHAIYFGPQATVPHDKVTAPDLAEYTRVRALSFERRRQVLEALGVDALASIRITVALNEAATLHLGNVVGNRELHPQSTIDFMLLDGATEDPVWHDPAAQGPRLDTSTSLTGRVASPNHYADGIVAAVDANLDQVLARRA